MTAPLTLPCDREQLAATVARLWPDVAAVCGVDSARVGADVDAHGELLLPDITGSDALRSLGLPAWWLALEHLARSLEDLGYEVHRDGSARVVLGWAAVYLTESDMLPVRSDGLEPWHPARADRGAALLRERQERDAATCSLPNPKLHARSR